MWLNNFHKSSFFGLIILCFVSCYYDKEDLLYGSDNCETSMVSFSNEIMPIINNSCATIGCHIQGGNAPGIFENYNQITDKINNGSFEQRVLIQKNMPPSSILSDCQLEHITQWIADSAPNN